MAIVHWERHRQLKDVRQLFVISMSMRVSVFTTGAFLVPYGLLAVVCGMPLFLLETSTGQYTQEGFITCWRKLCPLAQGEPICVEIRDAVGRREIKDISVTVCTCYYNFNIRN